jgi:peptidoglycan/xylan/chitin deacetylase (PgdA/CDA1 family)
MPSPIRTAAGSMCRWLARTTRTIWPGRAWWIVNYHDVSPGGGCPRPTLAPAEFERQVSALCKECKVIPLEEGFARVRANAIDGRFASITFDDGYAGVVRHAAPIMERHRVSGTVFVCGATLVHGRELWDIAMLRLVRAGRADAVAKLTGLEPPTLMGPGAMAAARQVWSLEIADALVQGAAALPQATAETITLESARALDPAVLRIGNHTWSHAVVSRLSMAQIVDEIRSTHEVIRALPAFTPAFAYPFGESTDMSDEATRLAQDVFGLQVVSAYGGFNRPGLELVEDARRVGVTGDARLPWDLVTSGLRLTLTR